MCLPQKTATQALMALSAGSSFMQFQQQRKAQKYAQARAIRQNALAKKNALQRYAAEQLKIRQVAKQSSEKGYQATLKARKARAEFTTIAGASGLAISGSTQALLSDFYRTEGNYKASLAKLKREARDEILARITLAGGSFPDLSKDGEITQEDILIGRGVIPEPKRSGGIAGILGV